MRLIYLLIIFLFHYSVNTEFVLLKKDESKQFNSRYAYIDITEFSFFKKLHINVKVKNGHFSGNYLYYGKNNNEPKSGELYTYLSSENYDSSETGSKIDDKNYTDHTLDYYVPRDASEKYYYLLFPSFVGEYIEVLCENGGTSVGSLWVVFSVCLVILVALVIFILYCYFKRKKIDILEQRKDSLTQLA